MAQDLSSDENYTGFEQGPIRPPNEARSLLIRITRNCPWNRCAFCPVYKAAKFSVRPAEHVKRDIDLIHEYVEMLRGIVDDSGKISLTEIQKTGERIGPDEWDAFTAASNWLYGGDMRSVFLQDADSLVIKPADLIDILLHLRKRFPSIQRVTSYARTRTVARRSDADLQAIREAGLDRIHIGLESGSDQVLAMLRKGITKAAHVTAGLKVKRAGMELSEYVMPGLGGEALSEEHARETADALNQIDPDFIRLRTLAIPPGAPLFEEWRAGRFKKCSDITVIKELIIFIEELNGITSMVKSDHMLNLFMELQGKLPQDKQRMIDMLRAFVDMDADMQRIYQVGRRLGILIRFSDLRNPHKVSQVEEACRKLGITSENVDEITDQIMMQFI